MRAAVVAEGGAFDVTTVVDPVARAGELLLQVSACGLCGSDLKARPAMPAGVILGHEFGGRVVGLGPGTDGWSEGMQAAVLPVASCGSCPSCLSGNVVHCASAVLYGLGGSPGGFAELVAVPAASSFAVPEPIDPLHTALVEPYAVGLHTVEAARIEPGDSVLVVGAGTVGLTSTTWARLRGAERITVVDPNEARRAGAGAFGASDVITDAAEAEQGAYDVALECVGKPGLLDACIAATRAKGRIVIAGVCTEQDPFWSMAALMKELSIHFAVYYTPDEFRTVIEAFVSSAITPVQLVGRTLGLGSLNEAFDLLAASSTEGKIVIDPSL
jgi:(R,R)-butanediol dehydrogenase/meso-butanediol dehydrogenase/diacetyl reductase